MLASLARPRIACYASDTRAYVGGDMEMQVLNGLSAGTGFLASILLAIGQRRSAAAAEVSLTLLEAGIRSLFTGEGPVFGGLEQQRANAVRARRYFSVPGWCLLAGGFGLRLIAILSN